MKVLFYTAISYDWFPFLTNKDRIVLRIFIVHCFRPTVARFYYATCEEGPPDAVSKLPSSNVFVMASLRVYYHLA